MVRRDIYLKIESIARYNPVVPDDADHMRYGIDCMRNQGHEDGRVPPTEIAMRDFDALVYREYLDASYTTPNTAPLVAADINEPPWDRRVPGTVLYAKPGERLYIHVFNCDTEPHSFHVHGLLYGIDSDGSWPFGVASPDGRRSDEICPQQHWTYIFDATEDTIGAWPFHDHHMAILPSVGRGLFGGIVVRDPEAPRADHEVPLFLHQLAGRRDTVVFDSGTLHHGDSYAFTFPRQGDFAYHCRFHAMTGAVHVTMGGPTTQTVHIRDNFYDLADVTVGVGGTVTWLNDGMDHTATETGGGSMVSFALNGRTFVGNTPTIVVESGQCIRWYVFNLDLAVIWHNFHVHGHRWQFADHAVDTRSLSPAESFVADTIVPPVVILGDRREVAAPEQGRSDSDDAPDHDASDHDADDRRRKVCLRGDFMVHCHVEDHMMEGMVGLVRVRQEVGLSAEQEHALGIVLPIDHGGNDCPEVDLDRCGHVRKGRWERVPDSPIFIVHAALMHTGKVLLWSGTAEAPSPHLDYPLESILWDPATPTPTITTQAFDEDLFCSGHAFLDDGRLVVAGGATTPGTGIRSTHIFDPRPGVESWSHVATADMAQARWYPTLLTLADGHVLALGGRGGATQEIFDGAAWTHLTGADRDFPELYPSNHLLPVGTIFYSRAGWNPASTVNLHTGYLSLGPPAAWSDLGTQAFPDRQEGTAVLQIDDTVSPPAAQVMIFGGGYSTQANAQSCEIMDVTTLSPAPSWHRGKDMAFRRVNVNAVLLPDGTILIVGGHQGVGRFGANQPVLDVELYDPRSDTWTTMAPMTFPRGYHSVALLLPDGRVLSTGGTDGFTNQRNMEVFSPPYLFGGPRPSVTAISAEAAYGATIEIDTPDAAGIDSVVLLRPASETHHTDAGMRRIRLAITGRTAGKVSARAPGNSNVAPPGYYQLFALSSAGVPSVGRFIRIHA
jgi:FtsP/CotA-like multicopper oxidase with cupredoxin domain